VLVTNSSSVLLLVLVLPTLLRRVELFDRLADRGLELQFDRGLRLAGQLLVVEQVAQVVGNSKACAHDDASSSAWYRSASSTIEDAIRVDVEGDLDLRDAPRRR